ncbi:hypothetical protein V5O48_012196 [Marasmius crinis-equi]|uniref:MARVEL domain-containing protein n=1 Tax=Marasmius crinis-equi TaxID=585013 RepID=A0ABR3F3R2_9AGAR
MAWAILNYVHMAVMSAVTLFSFINLAIAAHTITVTGSSHTFTFKDGSGQTITLTEGSDPRVQDFQALSIAAAVLTIISLPVFLVVRFLRSKSFLTMNVVEVPVCGFLSILWMANSIVMTGWATRLKFSTFGCGWSYWTSEESSFCSEFTAVEAFSFLNWISLFGYTAFVIILCLIGKSRGNNVWLTGANSTEYFAHSKPMNYQMTLPQEMHRPQFTGQSQVSMQQPQYTGQPQYQPQPIQMHGQMMYTPTGTPPVRSYSPAPGHAQV